MEGRRLSGTGGTVVSRIKQNRRRTLTDILSIHLCLQCLSINVVFKVFTLWFNYIIKAMFKILTLCLKCFIMFKVFFVFKKFIFV